MPSKEVETYRKRSEGHDGSHDRGTTAKQNARTLQAGPGRLVEEERNEKHNQRCSTN